MSEINIHGEIYVKKDSLNDEKLCIAILQRGWCMVVLFSKNVSECVMKNASVIRRWGTTKGLGEIAKNGPTDETVLNQCNGNVFFDYLTVVALIECDHENWKK